MLSSALTLPTYLDQSFVPVASSLCARLGSETRAKVLTYIFSCLNNLTGINYDGEKYVYLSYKQIADNIWRKVASTRRAIEWLVQEGYLIREQLLKHRFNSQLAFHREYCYRIDLDKLERLRAEPGNDFSTSGSNPDYSLSENQRSLRTDPSDHTTNITKPNIEITNKKEFSTSKTDQKPPSPLLKSKKQENIYNKKLDPVLEEILQKIKNMGVIVNPTILKLLKNYPLDQIHNAWLAMKEAISKGVSWRSSPNAWFVRAVQQGYKASSEFSALHGEPQYAAPYHKPYVPRPGLDLMPISSDHLTQGRKEISNQCNGLSSPSLPVVNNVQTFSQTYVQDSLPLDLSDCITAIKIWAKTRGVDVDNFCRKRFEKSWVMLLDDELLSIYSDIKNKKI